MFRRYAGFMPCLSTAPISSSCIRWLLVLSQGSLPWWQATFGGGSGKSSSNKLVLWRLDQRKMREDPHCLLRYRGGGRGDNFGIDLGPFVSVIASELGLWRWIRSRKVLSRWLWRILSFFFGCLSAKACLPPPFFVLMMGNKPAFPRMCSRPRRWNQTSVPFLWDGALFAVLKAIVGDDFCRLEDASGCSHPSDEATKVGRRWRGGDATKVEDGGLLGLTCDFVFYRGLYTKFICDVFVCVRDAGVLVRAPVCAQQELALNTSMLSQKKKTLHILHRR